MGHLRIVPREEWGATVPTFVPMPPGAKKKLFLHHTVTRPTADPFADMRHIEEIGRQKFGRFSYNYVVHNPMGVVMEGAGFTIGAHTAGHNSTALSICIIGNFQIHTLYESTKESILWLYDELVDLGQLTRDAYVRPHSAVKGTACPGNAVRLWLPEFIEKSHNIDYDWFAMATLEDLKTAIRETRTESTYVMAIEGKQYLCDESLRLASYIPDETSLQKLVMMFGARPSIPVGEFHSKFEVDNDQ